MCPLNGVKRPQERRPQGKECTRYPASYDPRSADPRVRSVPTSLRQRRAVLRRVRPWMTVQRLTSSSCSIIFPSDHLLADVTVGGARGQDKRRLTRVITISSEGITQLEDNFRAGGKAPPGPGLDGAAVGYHQVIRRPLPASPPPPPDASPGALPATAAAPVTLSSLTPLAAGGSRATPGAPHNNVGPHPMAATVLTFCLNKIPNIKLTLKPIQFSAF